MNFDFGEGRFSIHCLSVKFYFGVLFGMLRFFFNGRTKITSEKFTGGKKKTEEVGQRFCR